MHMALTLSWSPTLRSAITIGFIGGLTTYSSFNYETTRLLEEGAHGPAAVTAFATIAGSFAGGWLGLQSWEGSPELQSRVLAAARNIETPIFLTHPANDFSIVPGQKLSAELTRLKRPHELKIYPAVGDTQTAGQ
jgi:hypothetical protein